MLAIGTLPDLWLVGKVILAALACGLTSTLFPTLSHRLGAAFETHIPSAELRPVVSGLIVIGLLFLADTPDYLGLGVLGNRPNAIVLPALFTSTEIHVSAWAWKLLFTVVTLSAGFRGGEVTPLFFIGVALGNTLSAHATASTSPPPASSPTVAEAPKESTPPSACPNIHNWLACQSTPGYFHPALRHPASP